MIIVHEMNLEDNQTSHKTCKKTSTCGTLQLPFTPTTNRKSPTKLGLATRLPCPNCIFAFISGSCKAFEILYSPPSKSMSHPPISLIGPNCGVVSSPGKKPLGEIADWLRHTWIAAFKAGHESFRPVGSAPIEAGVPHYALSTYDCVPAHNNLLQSPHHGTCLAPTVPPPWCPHTTTCCNRRTTVRA